MIEPVKYMFSRPLSSGEIPAGTSTGSDPALDRDPAGGRIHHSRENLQQRPLAGAVGADQAQDCPGSARKPTSESTQW